MAHSNESKESLRRSARHFRRQLSDNQLASASQNVCRHLQRALDWQGIGSVHCYQAIAANKELDVQQFINWLGQYHPESEVYLQDWSGTFPDQQFEAIIVPGLRFDRHKNRLGYGKGMYDKFLATQPKACKIGVVISGLLVDKLPTDSHDVPMNYIITEKELYN